MTPVSVLLPVRNAQETLEETLDSLWRQTHRDFRLIAVDDGSSDRSLEILATHEVLESRMTLLRTGGEGLVPALNKGLAEVDTPYLARIDADDIAHKDRLKLQAAYLDQHPLVAAAGCKVRVFPRHHLLDGWRRYEKWINAVISPDEHRKNIFVESPLAHPSVMLRTAILRNLGGYHDPPWAEDYDLWLRLHEQGHDLGKVDRVLLGWRHHPARLSSQSERYSLERFMEARCHYLARVPKIRATRTVRIWGAGKTGRRLARGLESHGIRVQKFYEVAKGLVGKLRRNAPVVPWEDLESPGGAPLLVAVGAPGARDLIRPALEERGYTEGKDVWFVS